jgi:hypothetical protein
MANSTGPIFIKPTVAFNRGDTFVFGTWVCIADDAGSFQRRLTMAPNPKTGLVTLPEVIRAISPKNLAKFRSTINMPTSSSDPLPTRTRRPHGPPHASRLLSHRVLMPHSPSTSHLAHAEALIARWADQEIVSGYTSDSNPGSGYY